MFNKKYLLYQLINIRILNFIFKLHKFCKLKYVYQLKINFDEMLF